MWVDFEEGRNQSGKTKPSKAGCDRLNLSPHTPSVVEVESMIDVYYVSLTSQKLFVIYSDKGLIIIEMPALSVF